MDFKGPTNFAGAQAICKQYRKDSHLAEIWSIQELVELKKIGKRKYWLNGYNSKPSASNRKDYYWLHSKKPVSQSLWTHGEGYNGGERTFALEGNGFVDIPANWNTEWSGWYAVCELRSD